MNDRDYLAWEIRQYERRKKTRNERKRSRYEWGLILSVIVWAVFIVSLLAHSAFSQADEGKDIPPEENAPETLKTAIIEVEPEIYHRKAQTFYPVPLDHDLQAHIIHTCEDYGVDPVVVIAMIATESDFDPETIGDGGDSYGLMQVQPKWHSERMERLGVTDLLNPYQNVTVGIDYLSEMVGRGNGIEWSLAAYNAGATGANNGVGFGYAKEVLDMSENLKDGVQNG